MPFAFYGFLVGFVVNYTFWDFCQPVRGQQAGDLGLVRMLVSAFHFVVAFPKKVGFLKKGNPPAKSSGVYIDIMFYSVIFEVSGLLFHLGRATHFETLEHEGNWKHWTLPRGWIKIMDPIHMDSQFFSWKCLIQHKLGGYQQQPGRIGHMGQDLPATFFSGGETVKG